MEEKTLLSDNIQDVATLRKYVEKHGITEELQAFLNNSKEGIEKICEYCPRDISVKDIQKNPSYGDVCEYNTKDWRIICSDTFCKVGERWIFPFLFDKIAKKDIMADIYRYMLGINFCINEYPKTENRFPGATRKMRNWHIENLIKIFKDMKYSYWAKRVNGNETLYKLYFWLPSGLVIYFYTQADNLKDVPLNGDDIQIDGQMASLIEKDIIDRYNDELRKGKIWCIPSSNQQQHLSKKKKFIVAPFD